MDKLVSMDEAVARIPSGCTLALGGVTLYRRPVAFCKALIRRRQESGGPGGLTLLAFTAGYESDLLVGAGMVSRVHSCYFGLEIFGLAPMFTYYANRGQIEIIEESEISLAMGLRARIAGVGFMPALGWLGTDLPSLRPDVKMVIDPYSGEKLMAFPPIVPQVVVVHALRADPEGNAQIGVHKGIDEELVLAAEHVIVTAEEIVPRLEWAELPAPFVETVVHAEKGARPTSCHPLYPIDGQALLAYTESVADPAAFEAYIGGPGF
jgi:glutaconate CoA-transferase subunit A